MGTSSLFPLRDSYTKRKGKSEVRALIGETLNEEGRMTDESGISAPLRTRHQKAWHRKALMLYISRLFYNDYR
jgi:hypothetical protein